MKQNIWLNTLRYCFAGSFFITPILFTIFLIEKNIYFSLKNQNKILLRSIEQEKIRSANLALEFTKNQNHQKILDLHKQYSPNFRYIEFKDIITESDIETL